MSKKKRKLRDYPIGTKAHTIGGGCWIKTNKIFLTRKKEEMFFWISLF